MEKIKIYLFSPHSLESKEIYFISNMPSDPRAEDIVPIAVFSLALSLLATIYPSWRASKIQPAEALRYE